jgi:hypothetical protein
MSNPTLDTTAVPAPISIIVNAREKQVPGPEVTYAQIVALAFPRSDTPTLYTIAFHNADQKPSEGTLTEVGHVKVKHNTEFNVTPTTKS